MGHPVDSFVFKVSFLRAVAPEMGPGDLDAFRGICERATGGTLTVEDLNELDRIFHKFDTKRT